MMYPLQYTAPETTPTQYLIGIFTLLAIVAALVLLRYRAQYRHLPEDMAAHKAAITEGVATLSAGVRRFDTDAIRDGDVAFEREVRALVESASDPEDVPTSTREGVSAVRATIDDAVADATTGIPRRAIVAGRWALLLLSLAVPVVLTEALRRAVTGGTGLSAGSLVGELTTLAGSVADIGINLLGLFPASDILWALGLMVVLIGGGWLYSHWWLLVSLLAMVAAGLAVADRRGYDVEVEVWLGRREWLTALVGGALIIWAAGALPTAVGVAVGVGGIGAVLGALSATGASAVLVLVAYDRYREELLAAAQPEFRDDPSPGQIATILASRVTTILVWLAIPVTVVYGLVGVLSGDYLSLIAAVVTAPPDVQLALGLGVAMVVGLLALVVNDFARTGKTVLEEVGARQSLRVISLARGFPIVGAVLAFLLFHRIVGAVVPAGIGAVIVGLIVRGIYGLLRRARYRARMREAPDRRPRRLIVQVWQVPDADGETRYIAALDGERIAAPDADGLVTAIVGIGRAVADDGTHPHTLEHAYYQALTDVGIVDFDRVVRKEREKARTQMLHALRDADEFQLDREEFDAAVDDCARAVRAEMLDYLQSLQCLYVTDETVAYRPSADPWRETTTQ